jgi:hypothetical protein
MLPHKLRIEILFLEPNGGRDLFVGHRDPFGNNDELVIVVVPPVRNGDAGPLCFSDRFVCTEEVRV